MDKPKTLSDKMQWLKENEGCELADGYEINNLTQENTTLVYK